MRWYLAERYLPGVTPEELDEMLELVSQAAVFLAKASRSIRYLGSLSIPVDETCLCLYQSDSVALISEANERAGIRVDRIVEVQPVVRRAAIESIMMALEAARPHPQG